MKKLMTLTTLLLATLLTLAVSGCTKVKYLPCPVFEPMTKSPVLDLNGTGKMKRLSVSKWLISHGIVMEVKAFEKACYARDADFISTTDAINKYNETIEEEN